MLNARFAASPAPIEVIVRCVMSNVSEADRRNNKMLMIFVYLFTAKMSDNIPHLGLQIVMICNVI